MRGQFPGWGTSTTAPERAYVTVTTAAGATLVEVEAGSTIEIGGVARNAGGDRSGGGTALTSTFLVSDVASMVYPGASSSFVTVTLHDGNDHQPAGVWVASTGEVRQVEVRTDSTLTIRGLARGVTGGLAVGAPVSSYSFGDITALSVSVVVT